MTLPFNPQTAATSLFIILIVASLLFIFGARLVRWLTSLAITHAGVRRKLAKKDVEKRRNTLTALYVMIWQVIVVIMAAIIIAQLFFTKEQLAPLFASAGIIGIAVGFGAQALVRDFLAGLFILSESQYRVGDVIEIDTFTGTVERIGARSTVLRDVEGNVHYFPNGMIQHVINKTMGYSVARVKIAVVPETDIDKAAKTINKIGSALAKEPEWENKIIEPPHYVMLGELNASSAELIISGKVQPSDQWSVSAELKRRILDTFEVEGIELGSVPVAGTVVASKSKTKH